MHNDCFFFNNTDEYKDPKVNGRQKLYITITQLHNTLNVTL